MSLDQEKPWPADRVERRSIDSLVPYAKNSRVHTPAQIKQIAASIKEWGWTTPVLVDEDGMIIAGHARVLAAESLGIKEAPVTVAHGWSEAQKRAYVIADNKLTENSSFDTDLLVMEFGDLSELGFPLDLTGFSLGEVEFLVHGPEPEKLEDPTPVAAEASCKCPNCGHEFQPPKNQGRRRPNRRAEH
jgi:ParB-like chromosome segregation protein Spo0J